MNTSKYYHRLAAAAALTAISGVAGISRANTVVVSPTNMNGWTLNSFDDNGTIVNSGPYYGTAAMVTGPATPPLGVGSAELATPVGHGDGAAAIATEGYDGTLLSSVTALSYSTYDVTNNGSQFPYLTISIAQNDGSGNTDTLFFEPPYQQPATGNPALPDQGAPVQNQWQTWNAFVGGYWDNNGIGNPGTPEGLSPGVEPLAAFEAAYPLATIANGGYTGLGGIAMQVGFASGTAEGYVDAFTIGVAGVNTTYNFEPAAVPEPASFSILGLGALALLRRRRRA
ncbi:MAG TPA: PEP-CTERM sorting domain-containing protein [Tepidisphaeraceae bacterium]|jgi:hypothetical protein|nr:PEP-CTERM sorting domain-containing protein [Tepidisphaeraceae bacterium]